MITIGVIGYGYWGPNIVRNIVSLQGAAVSWICDLNPAVLKPIPRQYPTIQTTGNVNDVLTDPKTHAVIIATPPSTHFPLAKAAFNAGKHVLVEKPMTQSSQDARALVALSKKKNKILMVDHTFLYTPAVKKLKEIIGRGTLGRVFYVDSVRTNLGLFQKDSNVISDLSVHDFSIMDYLFGAAPATVVATGIKHVVFNQETAAYVNARYPRDLFLHCHVSWLSPVKIRRMMFVGTKKMAVYDDIEPSEKIKIYDKSVSVTALRVGYRSGNVIAPKLGVQEALFGVVSEFVRSIKSGKPPLSNGTQGLLVVRCIEKATQSL